MGVGRTKSLSKSGSGSGFEDEDENEKNRHPSLRLRGRHAFIFGGRGRPPSRGNAAGASSVAAPLCGALLPIIRVRSPAFPEGHSRRAAGLRRRRKKDADISRAEMVFLSPILFCSAPRRGAIRRTYGSPSSVFGGRGPCACSLGLELQGPRPILGASASGTPQNLFFVKG